jgi:hypothetical protein
MCLTFLTGSVLAADQTREGIAQAISPTTGMPYPAGRGDAYRPVLIEISNSAEARPHLAMSLADVVYEYVYWGPGFTRYLALYNDYHPETVGVIRSSKTTGMSLRNNWDCPLVFMGGQVSEGATNTYGFIETHEIPRSMLFDGTEQYSTAEHLSGVFSRLTSRVLPHNAIANLQLLVQERWPMGSDGVPYEPALPTLQFANKPSHSDVKATEIIIPYDEQDFLARYTYDVADGHYKRWYNGVPQLDGLTDQRITADNVIVLYADLTYIDNLMSQALCNLTGEGKLDVFIDGQYIPSAWRRSDDASSFEYIDENGSPLLLKPGKTFIQIVPQDMQIYHGG